MVRLRALFDCTLPFTCAEPFFTAAGLVPPESFFGRESERSTHHRTDSAVASSTADASSERPRSSTLRKPHFDNPASGHLAPFVDLKVHGIGKGRERRPPLAAFSGVYSSQARRNRHRATDASRPRQPSKRHRENRHQRGLTGRTGVAFCFSWTKPTTSSRSDLEERLPRINPPKGPDGPDPTQVQGRPLRPSQRAPQHRARQPPIGALR